MDKKKIKDLEKKIEEAAKRGDYQEVSMLTEELVSEVMKGVEEELKGTGTKGVTIHIEGDKRKEEKVKEEFLEDLGDIVEMKMIFKTLSEELPRMIKGIFSTIFSEDLGEKIGRMVGDFYTKLREKGLPEDLAKELTAKFAEKALSNASAISDFIGVMKNAVEGDKKGSVFINVPGKKRVEEVEEEEKEDEEEDRD